MGGRIIRAQGLLAALAVATLLAASTVFAEDPAPPPAAPSPAPPAAAAPSANAAAPGGTPAKPTVPMVPARKPITARALTLPGGGPDGVLMDYLACDRATGHVWVPAGNTGSVDVIEAGTDKVTQLPGFPTAEVERRGRKRTVGPSSASVGDGVVYVGNRADSTICAVDMKTRKKGACVALSSMPDGVAYVATTKEVWVTTPRDSALVILDASKPGVLTVKTTMKLEGSPEGYAVDGPHGIFYTNLEDKDRTLAIDVRSRAVKATWKPECGEEGPRGLALDLSLKFLFVACTEEAVVLDMAHDGAVRSRLPTGAGVDNIDYLPSKRQLYVAAGQGYLTVARVSSDGTLTAIASGATAEGARVVVADAKGGAYVADSRGGRILYFPPM
jgi:DNA-binding beta-propeller fold protein YncE